MIVPTVELSDIASIEINDAITAASYAIPALNDVRLTVNERARIARNLARIVGELKSLHDSLK